jgi:DNA-binding NarL/FixJ family response regulator
MRRPGWARHPVAWPRSERNGVRYRRCVAVAEGTFLVQQGLSQVSAALPGIEQVARCETAAQLERAVRAREVDVVVTDVSTRLGPPDGGIALAACLREAHPGIGVVILGHHVTPEHATRVFSGGSSGRAYLLRERIGSPDELERAIRIVAEGGSVTDPKLVEVLVAERARAETSSLSHLSPREVEVLALLAQGRSNGSIAEVLYLTKRAVEKHINSIFTKLDLRADGDTDRRVSAALLFLADRCDPAWPWRRTRPSSPWDDVRAAHSI